MNHPITSRPVRSRETTQGLPPMTEMFSETSLSFHTHRHKLTVHATKQQLASIYEQGGYRENVVILLGFL